VRRFSIWILSISQVTIFDRQPAMRREISIADPSLVDLPYHVNDNNITNTTNASDTNDKDHQQDDTSDELKNTIH
jgi:hypothetical protein